MARVIWPVGISRILGELRGVQIARRADLDPRLPLCVISGGSQPISSCEADDDQQVGLAQLEQEAGLGFDEVRVLVALGDGFDVDLSPPTSCARAARSVVAVMTLSLLVGCGRRRRKAANSKCDGGKSKAIMRVIKYAFRMVSPESL